MFQKDNSYQHSAPTNFASIIALVLRDSQLINYLLPELMIGTVPLQSTLTLWTPRYHGGAPLLWTGAEVSGSKNY